MMQDSYLLNLLAGQTLDACIGWMGVQGQVSVFEPLA
jgi:hypothetical protein